MGGAHGVDAKAKNFKGTMLKLAEYASPFKLTIILVFIFAACSAGFSILEPKILGWATTKLFEGLMAYSMGTGLLTDMDYIAKCIGGLAVLYLVSFGFAYLQGFLMSGVSMNITYSLRKDISEKMNRLPLKYYDTTLQSTAAAAERVFEFLNEEVIQAAKEAHCDEFIKALPDGYHMMLNESASNISQGQKQFCNSSQAFHHS